MGRKIGIVILAFFLSGCAAYYNVRVNGYLDKVHTQTAIMPGVSVYVLENKNSKNPILESEVKSKIEKSLFEKGYRLELENKADFYLIYTYAISSGKRVSEITPVYYPGDTGTIQTYDSSGKTTSSIVTFPGYTVYMPHKVIVYTSSLSLKVIDADLFRNHKEENTVWIGEALSTSQNSDLRDMINYLLVASFEHFGENTFRGIVSNIYENDSRVKKYLNFMPPKVEKSQKNGESHN